LLEWLVVIALSVLLTWGSADIFVRIQANQKTEEAQRELRDCAVTLEGMSWNTGIYAFDQRLAPPCSSNAARVMWFWDIPDGARFTVWRIDPSDEVVSPASPCRGWAINQNMTLWQVDGSGQACTP
jgi:hypothetical protein